MLGTKQDSVMTEAAVAIAQALRRGETHLAAAGATALAALLSARHLDNPVDLQRVLEMVLARGLAGTADEIRSSLDPDGGLHVGALLLELETAGTSEAKLVHALDRMLDGRGYAGRDRFLARLDRALAGTAGLRAAG